MKKLVIALLLIPSLCFGALYSAEVIVPWKGTGTQEDPYTPDWGGAEVLKYEDRTGQPGENIKPDPNLFIALIEADNNTLSAMEANGYIILWSEKIEKEIAQ